MKQEIIKLENLKSTRWLNFFCVKYKTERGKIHSWLFASRKENPFEDKSPDGVVIIATVETPEGRKVVVTKEYRAPINDYEYGFPAGLIEPGMSEEETVKKELKEETGLDLVKITDKSNQVYSSAGLTDESIVIYFVEAEGEVTQDHLEDSEDIETLLFGVEEIQEALKSDKKVGAKAWGVFYYYSKIGKI